MSEAWLALHKLQSYARAVPTRTLPVPGLAAAPPPAARRRCECVAAARPSAPGPCPSWPAAGLASWPANSVAGHLCRYCICWYRVSSICWNWHHDHHWHWATGPGAGMSRSVCACMCSYDKTNTPKMSKYEMKVCACMCMYLLVPSQYLHVSAGIMSVCACMCSYYKTITLKMSKYEL